MQRLLKHVIWFTAILAPVQCRTTHSPQSSVKIVGGLVDDLAFPATVGINVLDSAQDLLMICTGTFIRDDLLLTAAHCVTSPRAATFSIYSKVSPLDRSRPSSNTVIVHPLYDGPITGSAIPYDLAFIKFPKETLPVHMAAPFTQADSPPDVGSAVTMVGYGESRPSWEWAPVGKRLVGRNMVASISRVMGPFTMIDVSTKGTDRAATSYGDSGGPLYSADGKLIGITQSGIHHEAEDEWSNRFVDLSHSAIRKFMMAVLAGESSMSTLSGPASIVPKKVIPLADRPTESPAKSRVPYCIERSGQGYGPMTNCGSGQKCAKLAPDLRESCLVKPNWQGLYLCIANAGRGFGPVRNCEGEWCARATRDGSRDCVLSHMVHRDS